MDTGLQIAPNLMNTLGKLYDGFVVATSAAIEVLSTTEVVARHYFTVSSGDE
jgi:hypothetical protein